LPHSVYGVLYGALVPVNLQQFHWFSLLSIVITLYWVKALFQVIPNETEELERMVMCILLINSILMSSHIPCALYAYWPIISWLFIALFCDIFIATLRSFHAVVCCLHHPHHDNTFVLLHVIYAFDTLSSKNIKWWVKFAVNQRILTVKCNGLWGLRMQAHQENCSQELEDLEKQLAQVEEQNKMYRLKRDLRAAEYRPTQRQVSFFCAVIMAYCHCPDNYVFSLFNVSFFTLCVIENCWFGMLSLKNCYLNHHLILTNLEVAGCMIAIRILMLCKVVTWLNYFHQWESVHVFINDNGKQDFFHLPRLVAAKFFKHSSISSNVVLRQVFSDVTLYIVIAVVQLFRRCICFWTVLLWLYRKLFFSHFNCLYGCVWFFLFIIIHFLVDGKLCRVVSW